MPAAQRRGQLLDVAAALFAERGYARTTTAELARAAGVTEPIIYRHFASKRDLFVALIERTGEQTLELWSRTLADAQDPRERLTRLLGANVMVTDETGRAAYRVITQSITEVDDPEIRNALDGHFHQLHTFLCAEIVHGQEERRVGRRFDAEVIAWILIDLALGYGLLESLGVSRHGVGTDGQHVQDVIRALLLPRNIDTPDQGRGFDAKGRR